MKRIFTLGEVLNSPEDLEERIDEVLRKLSLVFALRGDFCIPSEFRNAIADEMRALANLLDRLPRATDTTREAIDRILNGRPRPNREVGSAHQPGRNGQ